MANFVKLDESKFPTTKGKRIDGMRFYEVDGKALMDRVCQAGRK